MTLACRRPSLPGSRLVWKDSAAGVRLHPRRMGGITATARGHLSTLQQGAEQVTQQHRSGDLRQSGSALRTERGVQASKHETLEPADFTALIQRLQRQPPIPLHHFEHRLVVGVGAGDQRAVTALRCSLGSQGSVAVAVAPSSGEDGVSAKMVLAPACATTMAATAARRPLAVHCTKRFRMLRVITCTAGFTLLTCQPPSSRPQFQSIEPAAKTTAPLGAM